VTLPFLLPPPDGYSTSPVWTGDGFRLGGSKVSVLEYSENFTGWSDDLTTLHEEAAGDGHPIDVASRQDALSQLRIHLREKADPTILEIGCSSGFMLKTIAESFPGATVVGADVVREPLFKLAKAFPNLPLMRFDLLRCPLPSASFDAIVILNVLEHIQDDEAAIRQLHRLLKPGGIVVVEVPAGPQLYDAYDKALMHFRRYRAGDLAKTLARSGFSIIRQSHLGFFLYPAFGFVKRRNQRRVEQPDDLGALVTQQASATSQSLTMKLVMSFEKFLGTWFDYPVGIRCLIVGRKAGAE
jgi:SAM-dependent methyltransferase